MKLFVVLLAVAAMAFASDTFTGEPGGTGFALPETDDVVDTYAYNSGEVFSSIPASFTDYAVCDDITNSGAVDQLIDTYTTWGVTTASNPTELELLVIADDTDAPDGTPTSMTSYPCTVTNSGFTFGSYTVWLAEIAVGQGDAVLAGTTVWLGPHRNDGSNWYPACGTTVTGSEGYRTLAAGWAWAPFSGSLVAGDLFKIVDATTSLQRNTWAGIKNMF